MHNHIVSIGTANPGEPIPQHRIGEFMKLAHGLSPEEARKLSFVYRVSGIKTRYSVLTDFNFTDPLSFKFFPKNKDLEPFPTTKERMKVFEERATELGIAAISKCLERSKVKVGDITHLILVSCTGMYAPGVEMEIIEKMGFKSTIERYSIHFMGCYASFNAIKLADRICDSDLKANVLVLSVEICTIHFQKEYTEDNLIANALFGDGAAAALITKSQHGLRIKDYESQIFREGETDMAWHIGDFGFEMKLSKYVPELLEKGIRKFKLSLENRFGLSKIRQFAIHPGGSQILNKVEQVMGIDKEQNSHSHQVLSNFGNMSSASILFVLEAVLQEAVDKGEMLVMGFGPGLTLETLLVERV
ncbi:type III polyketide synthase [Lunatibacter salilacus]|uniref:type III polyketide synthase n=1 Tax=Lunatibacter salilacus TaxID=2483804 RepID=UPI00131D1F6C|nr:type III polyketide synthase [Lunatibacter salilacus]